MTILHTKNCLIVLIKINVRYCFRNMSNGATVGASAANSNLIELKT